MNKVIISGNITRVPELSTTPSGVSVTKFTVAVNRKFSKEKEVDFINCVAWRATADLIAKYMNKGSKGLFIGSIQIRNYDDKDGNKRYVTEVIVDEVEFLNSAEKSDNKGRKAELEDIDNSEMPF